MVKVRSAVGLAAAAGNVMDQSADSVLASSTGWSGTNTNTGTTATTRLTAANTTHSRAPRAMRPMPASAAASSSPAHHHPPANRPRGAGLLHAVALPANSLI